MVTEITSKAQFDEIMNNGKLVFIDYYTTWCGPCKFISPIYEQHAEEHKGKEGVEFYKLNIETVPDVAKMHAIRSIPTFHAYQNGERIDDLVGADRNKLMALIQTGLQRV